MAKRAKKTIAEILKIEEPKRYVCKQCGKVALLLDKDKSNSCRRCGQRRWTISENVVK